MKLQTDDMSRYLESSDIIDFGNLLSNEVSALAFNIARHSKDEIECIKNAFEYVRDNISHSADINGKIVTCKASEVLKAKEGICYAKSHLLAAILRYNSIPAGFCYQRLILNDETAPYLILHGLNAIFIQRLKKWIRLDARGNKPGVDAQFSLEHEQLAFQMRVEKGEENIPIIFAYPDENVVKSLTNNKNLKTLWTNLPTTLSPNTQAFAKYPPRKSCPVQPHAQYRGSPDKFR